MSKKTKIWTASIVGVVLVVIASIVFAVSGTHKEIRTTDSSEPTSAKVNGKKSNDSAKSGSDKSGKTVGSKNNDGKSGSKSTKSNDSKSDKKTAQSEKAKGETTGKTNDDSNDTSSNVKSGDNPTSVGATGKVKKEFAVSTDAPKDIYPAQKTAADAVDSKATKKDAQGNVIERSQPQKGDKASVTIVNNANTSKQVATPGYSKGNNGDITYQENGKNIIISGDDIKNARKELKDSGSIKRINPSDLQVASYVQWTHEHKGKTVVDALKALGIGS